MAFCGAVNETDRHYYDELFGFLDVYKRLHRYYVVPVICIAGVFANMAIVIVLLRSIMRRNPINIFLVGIAICDMTLMGTYFIFNQIEMCHPWYFTYAWIIYTHFYAIFSVFAHCASLWLTVAMAGVRFLIMNGAGRNKTICRLKADSVSATLIAIVIAVGISLLGSVPNMLRYRIDDRGSRPLPLYCIANSSSYSTYYISNTDKSPMMVRAYALTRPVWWSCTWERFNFWTAGLLLKLIPCLLLTIFMTLLVRMLFEARSRRNRLLVNRRSSTPTGGAGKMTTMSSGAAERTTTMLILIVLIFWICELPQGILVLASGIEPTLPYALFHLNDLIDLLSLINSSFNFILYCAMSTQFRQQFLLTFGSACCCRSKLSTTATNTPARTVITATTARNGSVPGVVVTIATDPNGQITPI